MVFKMQKVQLKRSEIFRLLKEQGLSKEQIREQYYPALTKAQWQKALKQMSLSSVRSAKIEYEIVPEENIPQESNLEIMPETTESNPVEEVESEDSNDEDIAPIRITSGSSDIPRDFTY